jgi:hypothetical protein
MHVRTINTNLMNRMITLSESHPYVCSMNAKAELRTILWGVLVGSEVLAKVVHMQAAMAEYRLKCESMGMGRLNAAHSNPKDVRITLARTSREWCYMKHTLMWKLMSKHKPLEAIDWTSSTLDIEVADKFYAIRPDCPEGKGCNRCEGDGECGFCGGEYLWLMDLLDTEGIDFTPCLEYSVLKPEKEIDAPINKSTPGFQKLLVQFEAIKQIGLSAVNFPDGQASCHRKDVDVALLAIAKSLMHKPGTDYKVPKDGATKFDYQVAERVYSLDGFTLGLDGGQAPHSASMVVPSRLRIRGNIQRGKGAKDLKDSASITMPLEDLVLLNPDFVEDANKVTSSLSNAGETVKPSILIGKLSTTYTKPVAHRLVHEHLPSAKRAKVASNAAKARHGVEAFEAFGANPNPPSAKAAAQALSALEPWCPTTTKPSETFYDFGSGYMVAHPAFYLIGPKPVWIKWGNGSRSQVPVRGLMDGEMVEMGPQAYIHKHGEASEDEASEDEAGSQGVTQVNEAAECDGEGDEDEDGEDDEDEDGEDDEDDGDKGDEDDDVERQNKEWMKRMNGWQDKG